MKKLYLTSLLVGLANSAMAHDSDSGMMWSDGGMMHNAGHMMGYNMWGPGWTGMLFGVLLWALAILGAIHLYQELTEEE